MAHTVYKMPVHNAFRDAVEVGTYDDEREAHGVAEQKSGDDPSKAVYFVPDANGGFTPYDHGKRVGHFKRMEARQA